MPSEDNHSRQRQHHRLLLGSLTLLAGWLPHCRAAQMASQCDRDTGSKYWLEGRMPGIWRSQETAGSKWSPLGDGGCTSNLLKREYKPGGGVLFFGDSNDGFVKTPYCWLAGTNTIYPDKTSSYWALDHFYHHHDHSNLNYCKTNNGLGLAHFYLPGVHPTGPFHMGLTANYVAIMHKAISGWFANVSSVPPTMVVISSSLWDLSGSAARNDAQLWTEDTNMPWLQGYMNNLTLVRMCV